MVEVLPIRVLRDEDTLLFGNLNVSLGKLLRGGLAVASGIVISAPSLKLKTSLEHFDFGHKEIFEQSLELVKKDLKNTPVPENLIKEASGHRYFLDGEELTSLKELWFRLLTSWLDQIKSRLWQEGFTKGLTENLEPKGVIFVKDVTAFGEAYFDSFQDDVIINIKRGKCDPTHLKQLSELVILANKKLFVPHTYEWILDRGIKIVKIKPFTPIEKILPITALKNEKEVESVLTTVKTYVDMSKGFTVEKQVDGVFISSEKIFNLNSPKESFEELTFKIVEAASSFPHNPVLVKLADFPSSMGGVRGALRLSHQDNLFNPLVEAILYARNKHRYITFDGGQRMGHLNVHIVIPFVRTAVEFLELKRKLATKKLIRKNSLQIWLEIAVPENILNLEEYLLGGVDGVILNLDEIVSFLNGFDKEQEEVSFYKKEVKGLINFLEDSLKLLHKSGVKFLSSGNLSLYPEILEFLVEKGVFGIIVERYEAQSIKQLVHQVEKKIILKHSI